MQRHSTEKSKHINMSNLFDDHNCRSNGANYDQCLGHGDHVLLILNQMAGHEIAGKSGIQHSHREYKGRGIEKEKIGGGERDDCEPEECAVDRVHLAVGVILVATVLEDSNKTEYREETHHLKMCHADSDCLS